MRIEEFGVSKEARATLRETFKHEFKCNRAELLEAALDPEGPAWPAIDCPSLLRVPGISSRISSDYIALLYASFPFISTMVSIVTDKENKTGIIMKMMGLKPSVYWTVTYFIEVAKTEAYMIMIQILGLSFRFRIFTFHDWFQYTLMLFLFSNVSVMFSFFMSTFFTKTSTTLAVSFLFAVLSFQLGIVFIHLVFTLDGGRESSFGPFMVHPFWVLRYLDGIALMFCDGQGVSFNL